LVIGLLLFTGALVASLAEGALTSGATGWGGIGAALTALAIFMLAKQKPSYAVVLTTAGGEIKTCHSRDGDFILRVVAALNDAIVARG
jgi:hypothetical protein